jgi:hypothetical protein
MASASPAQTVSTHLTVYRAQRGALRRIWRYMGCGEPNYTSTPKRSHPIQTLSTI